MTTDRSSGTLDVRGIAGPYETYLEEALFGQYSFLSAHHDYLRFLCWLLWYSDHCVAVKSHHR